MLRLVSEFATLDSDHDLITDSVERELGTDPDSRDSDSDGLSDWYELFGKKGMGSAGTLSGAAKVAPQNAAADLPETLPMSPIEPASVLPAGYEAPDHDSDGAHDALDSAQYSDDEDGDGLSNGLEGTGCFLDLSSGEPTISPWKGQTHQMYKGRSLPVVVLRSNPCDADSDGDGYGDGEEVLGSARLKNVAYPGTHPLVAAMPVLSARVDSVVVTRKAKITTTQNKVLQNSWSQDVKAERSTVTKYSQSVDADAVIDTKGAKGEVRAHTGKQTTRTDSRITNTNRSNFSSEEWSSAEQVDTGNAAEAKVTLYVDNVGTAPAFDCRPQFTVGLGSSSKAVATVDFRAEETFDVMPGDTYGPVERTVDLNLDELKAFMTGAPVWVEFVQYRARDDNGVDWDRRFANVVQACAKYVVDDGDGVVSPVYVASAYRFPTLPKQASVPSSTLGDALNYAFSYVDGEALSIQDSQGVHESTLGGWRFALSTDGDKSLFADWTTASASGARLVDLEVFRKDVIVAKAPPRGANAVPHVHWASAAPDSVTKQLVVRASADDYFGIESVCYRSPRKVEATLTLEATGDVYRLVMPSTIRRQKGDVIVARNDRGMEATLAIATPEDLDYDGGGLLDVWEMAHGSNASIKADDLTFDTDKGGLPDIREIAAKKNARDPSDDAKTDSDGGGVSDIEEMTVYLTDPDDDSDDKLMKAKVYKKNGKRYLRIENLCGEAMILTNVTYKADHYGKTELYFDPMGRWPATMFSGLEWHGSGKDSYLSEPYSNGDVCWFEPGQTKKFEWKNCWPWTNRTWAELDDNFDNIRIKFKVVKWSPGDDD